MPKKHQSKNICCQLSALFSALLFLLSCCIHPLIAQENSDFNDEGYKISVLEKITQLLKSKYVLADRAEKYAAAFKEKYTDNYYDAINDAKEFAAQVSEDLIHITKDKHIHFRVIESSNIGERPESSLHHSIRYHLLGIDENKGFSKLEWMEGNIGYLDIRRFYYFPDIRDRVIAAIKFISNADAVIIDLRENGGGSGDYLSSYFLKYPTQLTGWYSREDDYLTEFWTIKETGIQPLTDVPLFILTGPRTFSAAESFAYDMKVRNRAIIVGDSTKGGAHSVDLYKLDDRFEIYIPTVRAVNPLNGENWEGTGVIPDVLVPAETALDTAIVLAKQAGAEFARARDIQIKPAVVDMQIHMDDAEQLFRENKITQAEAALDTVFQIANQLNMINEFFLDVLAYNFKAPEDDQILYAILQKKISYFPYSPGAYESLAYAYYKNNVRELAIANFEKVLELEPDNHNAIKMIKRIKDGY